MANGYVYHEARVKSKLEVINHPDVDVGRNWFDFLRMIAVLSFSVHFTLGIALLFRL